MSGIHIYYDGDCVFCNNYIRLLRIRQAVGPVRLVNLRESPEDRQRFAGRHIDIDRGMVVEMDSGTFVGDDALHVLAAVSTGSDLFNRTCRVIFRRRMLAAVLYPVLRLFRNGFLLFSGTPGLAGRTRDSLYELFCVGWGIFSCLHFIVYATQFGANLYWGTWLILPLAGLLVLFPGDRRIFFLLISVQVVDAVLQMPSFSNHTIIKNFFLLALMSGGLYCAIRGCSCERFFQSVAPVGRALLIIMYILGYGTKSIRTSSTPR